MTKENQQHKPLSTKAKEALARLKTLSKEDQIAVLLAAKEKRQESLKLCQQTEQQNQIDLNEESTQAQAETDCQKDLRHYPSKRINCLTHFVSPWTDFDTSPAHKFPSSET